MNYLFYPTLAFDGIRKNKRLYIPYILSGIVMVMMTYIFAFLKNDDLLHQIRGGATINTMLPIGNFVVTLFSIIFMFYCNSFLIRQRYKEFALYNILGMDKRNLKILMLIENTFIATITIIVGLIFGIAFSKIAELGLLNLLNEPITYTFKLNITAFIFTLTLFIIIYTILLLNSLIKVHFSKPVELLLSGKVGEKAPKANWFIALIGLIILCIAYYYAISIKHPLTAVFGFMLAAGLVIIATYLLFITGSVALCKILQKNKTYYYKSNHFISVSSMVYRMKRNGAGLASICVLITMVLVIICATLNLYVSIDDMIVRRFPKEISLFVTDIAEENYNETTFTQMVDNINQRVDNQVNPFYYSTASIIGFLNKDGIKVSYETELQALNSISVVSIISLDTYNQMNGTNETLNANECLIDCRQTKFTNNTFTIENMKTFNIKSQVSNVIVPGVYTSTVFPIITIVVEDYEATINELAAKAPTAESNIINRSWYYSFDINGTKEAKIAAYDSLEGDLNNIVVLDANGDNNATLESKETLQHDYFALYAGIFYIGILLSGIFLFATVLIIYYKQISEGYEDQNRFDIMKKVGLTNQEIKKTINSQILTVFFLPLLLAGAHLIAAMPVLIKILKLFNYTNVNLMIISSGICFLVFTIIYSIVYKITSNSYYTIVSGSKK